MNSLNLVLLVSLICFGSCLSESPELWKEWESFKVTYNKRYHNKNEETYRMKVFAENMVEIAKHNALYATGQKSYSMKMNRFGDMLNGEVYGMMNGLRSDGRTNRRTHSVPFVKQGVADSLPKSVDWRQKGAVTHIKDQGDCGSCWAFSTTGSIEGQHFLKTGELIPLSEQLLLDCSQRNHGCYGGLMDNAFKDIIEGGGIQSEETYPYRGYRLFCAFNETLFVASIRSYVEIDEGDEDALNEAVAKIGPISIAIDASKSSFHYYEEGIYDEPECEPDYLNHAVLAVGYGEDANGEKYWIVKNSWGEDWGDKGYIKMKRGKNMCGVASDASYPVI